MASATSVEQALDPVAGASGYAIRSRVGSATRWLWWRGVRGGCGCDRVAMVARRACGCDRVAMVPVRAVQTITHCVIAVIGLGERCISEEAAHVLH